MTATWPRLCATLSALLSFSCFHWGNADHPWVVTGPSRFRPAQKKNQIYIIHLTIYIIMMETDRHGAIQLTQSVFIALFLFYSVLFIVLWEYYGFILVDRWCLWWKCRICWGSDSLFDSNVKIRVWNHSHHWVSGQTSVLLCTDERLQTHLKNCSTAGSISAMVSMGRNWWLHGESTDNCRLEMKIFINEDACLNSSHDWTLEAAADRKGPTKVWTLILHSFMFETLPYHRKCTFYSRRFFFVFFFNICWCLI